MEIVLTLIAVFSAIVFHEYAHGYVAFRLGDPTARAQGRLTFNPLAHIDPIGTVLVPIVLILLRVPFIFGWAKPVPVNPMYFRNPYQGMFYVAIAGPLTNVGLAVATTIVGRFLLALFPVIHNTWLVNVFFLLGIFILINLLLALFNMIPIPPLDGSRILSYFLPPEGRRFLAIFERYGFLIILGFFLLGGLGVIFTVVETVWVGLIGRYWRMIM